MATEVLMPALSPTMTEGKLVRWVKKEGDNVTAGDVLAEVETDKATMEVEAVDEGTLGRILVQAGQSVPVNTPIAILVAHISSASSLKKEYLADDYIFLVNKNGTPGDFTGLEDNINKDQYGRSLGVPYKICRLHTKEALEKLQQANKPTVDPSTPTVPGETTAPGGTADSGTRP